MTLRKKIRFTAIALLLGYTIVRFLFVRAVLEGYGVSPWAFLIIDSATAVTYVIGIEHLVVTLVHKGKREVDIKYFLFWGAVTGVSFAAPYTYIYSASRELPLSLGIGIGVIIVILLLNAVATLVRQIRRAKGE